MIIALKYYREFGWVKTLRIALAGAAKQIFWPGSFGRRFKSLEESGLKPPMLKKDDKGTPVCISCGLCEQVCPTNAVKIIVENKISFPKSLETGPPPKDFAIDGDLCLRCSLCVEICPVDALTSCSQ